MYLSDLEISPQALAEKLSANQKDFYLLDVRELWELNYAKISHARVVVLPMSEIARQREQAFPEGLRDPECEIVVMCHHGIRSMQVTQWMRAQGWKNVTSLAGGIDAYAQEIDPGVGAY
jgi:rhodanese-related sulfurtransferase